MKIINFDNASATPLDNRVLEVMLPYFKEKYGNPSSIHALGRDAKEAIDNAREKVAHLLGADSSDEIIFTSCGTESNNMAILGVAYRRRREGNHIITSTIEHMSVLNACKFLSRNGFRISYIPVDEFGTVDLEALKKEITRETILVTIMHANGEVGTIQPIKEVAEIAKDVGATLHTDAVASAGKIPIQAYDMSLDLVSVASSDIYGPKGVGALFIRKRTAISPVSYGGGQEKGFRSGTENVPGIVGMGEAAKIAEAEMPVESRRIAVMRDDLIAGLKDIPHSYLNGHPAKRLPNNVNVRFSYIEGESILLSLEMEGIIASTGSACTSKTLMPSHVLTAMGIKPEEAHGSLQITLGRFNKPDEVKHLLRVLPPIVKRLRSMSPLTPKEVR